MSHHSKSEFPIVSLVAGVIGVTVVAAGLISRFGSKPIVEEFESSAASAQGSAQSPTSVSTLTKGEKYYSADEAGKNEEVATSQDLLKDFAPKPPEREVPTTPEGEIRALVDSETPRAEVLQQLRTYLRRNHDNYTRNTAVGYLMAMVEDHEYIDVLADELRNSSQPEDVMEALGNDIHSRDHRVMMPMMYELANSPGHPLREHAQNTLEVYLADTYTSSPSGLRKAISDYLAEYE